MIPVVVYEGVSGAEALTALAALQAAGLDAELASGEAMVRTREGARLVPARLGLGALGTAEAAVVPGGDLRAAFADAELARLLRGRRGRWTLFSGDAVHLAVRAGLAEGRRVARPPDGAPLPGVADVASARLVADGRLLTCTGGDALPDLALVYATSAVGEHAARAAAERLGREWRPFALGATEGA